jgi:hypothetical protein
MSRSPSGNKKSGNNRFITETEGDPVERSMSYRHKRKKPFLSFSPGEFLVTLISGSIALFQITLKSYCFLGNHWEFCKIFTAVTALLAIFFLMGKKRSALFFSFAFSLALTIEWREDINFDYFWCNINLIVLIAQWLSFFSLLSIRLRKGSNAPHSPSSKLGTAAVDNSFSGSPGPLISGRYQVLSLLGTGASGAVYRVRDLQSPGGNAQWALKEISPLHCNDDGSDDAEELLKRE